MVLLLHKNNRDFPVKIFFNENSSVDTLVKRDERANTKAPSVGLVTPLRPGAAKESVAARRMIDASPNSDSMLPSDYAALE